MLLACIACEKVYHTRSCLSRIVDNCLLSFRPRVTFIRAEISDGSKDMTKYLKEKDNEGGVVVILGYS